MNLGTVWRTLLVIGLPVALVLVIGWNQRRENPVAHSPEAESESFSKPSAAPETEQPAPVVIHSQAGMVGSARCQECHSEIYQTHARTGHARTFARTSDSGLVPELCAREAEGGDKYGRFRYRCDADGLAVLLPETFPDRAFPLEFVLGSGDHAATFLSLVTNQFGETIGVEHRCTWYRESSALGITPGQQDFEPRSDAEHFGRIYEFDKTARCISCHTTAATIVGREVRDLVAGVQCEACHGPGERHVRAAETGDSEGIAASMPLPASALDEITLCGGCHRLPEDIEAGRLARYPSALARFQPVGLLRSRCYLESGGELRCSTCHDPHVKPAARTTDQQDADCRMCHQTGRSSLCGDARERACIGCHMPRQEMVPGVSFHDHWIRIRPEYDAESPAASSISGDETPARPIESRN